MNRRVLLARLAAVAGVHAAHCAVAAVPEHHPCRRDARAAGALEGLREVMATGRFIAYQPTAIRIYDGRPAQADEASIEADLRVLRSRFDGLITYGSSNGAERVADVAARLGFRAVIPGIWSFDDAREVANALAAAERHPGLVTAVCLGNERIFARERTFDFVATRLRELHERAPRLALTTAEPFHLFVTPEARPLLAELDFLLANVHPVFQPWFAQATAADAARFVVNVVDELARAFCGPVLVKETGVPTAPAERGFNPERQAAFYAELRRQFPPSRDRAFAWFSAFDAAWRVHDAHPGETEPQPQEGSWGLWTEDRRPKPAVAGIPTLP